MANISRLEAENHNFDILLVAPAAANVHTPASNAAAVVTLAAVSNYRHVLGGVAWSYDGAPTGGNLTIEHGSGVVVLDLDITASGPGFLPLTPPLVGDNNTALIVTLAAGGTGVVGKLSILSRWQVQQWP
jgi:hypothetical protein